MSLQLTYKEIQDLTLENSYDRFEITHHDIPYPEKGEKDYHTSNYEEKDGRKYYMLEFTDKETNKEYYFQYVWYADYTSQFPDDMLSLDSDIQIVDVSVINPPVEKVEVPVVEEPVILSEYEQMLADYKAIESECVIFDSNSTNIPKEKLKELLDFVKTKQFSMNDLRSKFTPVCIEYKTERNSLWGYIRDNAS